MNLLLDPEHVLARVKRLPALPRAVHALNEAMRSDTVQVDGIVAIVGTDQALTVAALRLANSSFYGVGGRVVTLRDAVQILGLHTLSAAVMTAAVMSSFEPGACPGFGFDAAWRHAMASAMCAQRLALSQGHDADVAYTTGLLHDIGRLALATYYPEHFSATLRWAAAHQLPPAEAETVVLGMDHAHVGSLIAQHWRLAPQVVEAIRLHHELPPGGCGSLLDVLHLTDGIVHALDLSAEPDEFVPAVSIDAWDRIGLCAADLPKLFEHIEGRMAGVPGTGAGRG